MWSKESYLLFFFFSARLLLGGFKVSLSALQLRRPERSMAEG